MVATFVSLKLRLYRNAFRAGGASRIGVIGAIAASLLAATFVFVGAVEIRTARPELADPWSVIFIAALVLMWSVVPLSMGYTDATVDPTRLLLVPMNRRQLMSGLLAAALTGLVPLATFAALMALLVLAVSAAQVVYNTAVAIVGTGLCIAIAQTGAAVASGAVKRQGARNIASAIIAGLGTLLGVSLQFAPRLYGLPVEQVDQVARWTRWLPGGWLGQGVVWARHGQWFGALMALLAAILLILGLVTLWARVLERMLVSPVERVTQRVEVQEFVPAGLRWLPEPIATTTSRSLKLLRRDNREWASLVGTLPLLLLAAMPLAGFRPGEATLLIGSVGLYGGLVNGALLMFDGPALWVDQQAHATLRPLLVGKVISRALIVTPLLVVAGLALAIFTGGWLYLPTGVAAAICGFGVMSGFGVVGSVRFAVAAPDTPNVFGGQAGQSKGVFAQLALLLLALLATSPVLGFLVASALWRWWAGWLVGPVTIAYGLWALGRGLRIAITEADAQAPELLARLQL